MNAMTRITRKEQYEWAVKKVEGLLNRVTDTTPPEDPDRIELELLSNLVADYSEEHFVQHTVEVIIENARTNLCAYIKDAPVCTVGDNLKEIIENIKEAISLYLEENPNPCDALNGDFTLEFKIDAETFLNH